MKAAQDPIDESIMYITTYSQTATHYNKQSKDN